MKEFFIGVCYFSFGILMFFLGYCINERKHLENKCFELKNKLKENACDEDSCDEDSCGQQYIDDIIAKY